MFRLVSLVHHVSSVAVFRYCGQSGTGTDLVTDQFVRAQLCHAGIRARRVAKRVNGANVTNRPVVGEIERNGGARAAVCLFDDKTLSTCRAHHVSFYPRGACSLHSVFCEPAQRRPVNKEKFLPAASPSCNKEHSLNSSKGQSHQILDYTLGDGKFKQYFLSAR
jgi:hypothetical protein